MGQASCAEGASVKTIVGIVGLLNSLQHEVGQRYLHGAEVCGGSSKHVVGVEHYDFVNQQIGRICSSIVSIAIVEGRAVFKRSFAARRLDRKFTLASKLPCLRISNGLPAQASKHFLVDLADFDIVSTDDTVVVRENLFDELSVAHEFNDPFVDASPVSDHFVWLGRAPG